MAAEAVLVHGIAPPHPRYTQLTQLAAEVAKRTQGTLTIAINPGGKVLYPGQASLDAVRNKTVPLTFVNSAFLQSIDADLGFLNLPFTITDQLMAKPGGGRPSARAQLERRRDLFADVIQTPGDQILHGRPGAR